MPETINPVAQTSGAVQKMQDAWEMVTSLLGGTTAMRQAGTKYLPKWPAEPADQYATRLACATLFPAYSHTMVTLAGKPFSRPVTRTDIDPAMDEWLDDIDQEGRNLDAFGAEVIECAIAYGQAHILVDFPNLQNAADAAAGKPLSVAQEKVLKARPYMVLIKPTRILGWRQKQGRLLQVRFTETVEEDDQEFGVKEIEQIRVLEPGKWEVFRQAEVSGTNAGQWVSVDKGVTTMTEIPFVTLYGRRIGFMQSKPPLIELAHLNVKHWQEQSDQDNTMHVVRVPILTAAGVNDNFELVISSKTAVKLPPNATLQYTEHSGAAIDAGRQALMDLQEDMRQAGSELMVMRAGPQRTATEVTTDESGSMTDLQRITQGAEDVLDQAIDFMAQFGKIEYKGSITLFNEFGALTSAVASAPVIIQASTAGILSKETAFNELKRRGMVSPDTTYEDEQGRLQSEGPPVGKIDPTTGLPFTKPIEPSHPTAKIDPLTGLPYKQPVQPVIPNQPPRKPFQRKAA
jgi:hypothetical protein